MGANIDKEGWDVVYPQNADQVSAGALEARSLREAVEDRLNKSHVGIAGSGVGGEPLEGSARIHTATSAPTNQVIGAVDTSGSAANVTIASNTAIAEGAAWVKTDSNYVMQVYAAAAWHDIGHVNFATGITQALTTTNKGIDILNSGSGEICCFLGTATSSVALQAEAQAGSSTYAAHFDGENTGSGAAVVLVNGKSGFLGDGIDINMGNSMAHFTLRGDPTVASPADGDMWFDGTVLKIRVSSTTKTIAFV